MKTTRLNVRLSQVQLDAIKDFAKRKKLSVSNYVLEMCIPKTFAFNPESLTSKIMFEVGKQARTCMKSHCGSMATKQVDVQGMKAWLCEKHEHEALFS